jgi:hypothetical protein
MDQGINASFKAYYFGWTFTRLEEAADNEDGPTMKEFCIVSDAVTSSKKPGMQSLNPTSRVFGGNCALNLFEILRDFHTQKQKSQDIWRRQQINRILLSLLKMRVAGFSCSGTHE